MTARLWQRPSAVVVATAALWLGYFAWNGRLRLQEPGLQEPGLQVPGFELPAALPAASPSAPAPVVVKAGQPAARAAKATVRGKVVDTAGYLLVGAEVHARGGEAVRTDADGVFVATVERAPRSEAGTAELHVEAPGSRAAWTHASLVAPDGPLVRLAPAAPWDAATIPPASTSGELFGEGTVRGIDGRPVVGAFVTVAGSGIWARTDEVGRYSLPLPAEAAVLVVHAPDAGGDHGLAARSEPIAADRRKGIVPLPEIVAEPAVALRGRVADPSGSPVGGAMVEVRGNGISRLLESGISGVFRLAGLQPGTYEVRPLPHRGGFGRPTEVVLADAVASCELVIEPARERRVRIVDERGHAVPRAHVAAHVDGDRCSVAQADSEGFAPVRAVLDRTEWEVRAEQGFAPLAVRRFDADEGALVVALP